MNYINRFYTLIGFKITWMSCILGELFINSWVGFVVGAIYLLIFFTIHKNKLFLFFLVFSLSLLGYSFDTSLSFFNLYKINAETYFLLLPIWFLVLWPSFICLLVDCFKFLKDKFFLPLVLSFFGPLSYYSGISTGLVEFSGYLVFIIMYLFWVTLFLFFSNFILKKYY